MARQRIAGALLACGVLACGAPPGEGPGAGDTPAAAPTIRLKVQAGFPLAMPVLGETIAHFRDSLDAMQVTGLDMKVYDVDKLVKPLQIFDAVSAGKIDAGLAFPGYWLGKVPAAAVFGAVPFGPDAPTILAWLQEGGGLELWREIYATVDLVPIPCGALPPEAAGWFRHPIESVDDLVGLKIRYAGLGGKVLEKLGASATQIPAGDIFVSLERGVIDATEYSMPVVDRNLGFHKVAKHYYFPGWHQPSSILELIVHKPVWDSLAPHHRAAIETTCGATTMYELARGSVQADALAFFESEGVTIHTWPPEVLAALREATDELLAEMSAEDEDFARALESLRAFQAQEEAWSSIAYPPKLESAVE